MNAITIMYVNDHLERLRAEAKRDGYVSLPRRSLREQLGSVSASFRRVLGNDAGPMIPKLENYPYGG